MTTTEASTLAGGHQPFGPERVERLDVRHLGRVVWNWKVLIAAGTIFVLGATAALLRLTPPAYSASTVVLIDQPGLVASPQNGLATAQKLLNLTPTFAGLARSDPVLQEVRELVEADATIDELRSRIITRPVPDTFAIEIQASDAEAVVAEQLAAATATALERHLNEIQAGAEVPENLEYTLTALLEPDAQRPGRNEARTLVLATLLGFFVMVGVAFFLEYLQQEPEEGHAATSGDAGDG